MYRFLFVALVSLFLCACAGSRSVNIGDGQNRNMVYVDNKWGATAVFVDDAFAGSTPIGLMLPEGKHRIVMNYGGKIVCDTVIDVTDDFSRNSTAAIVGGGVAGFVPLLLMPFPVNMLVATIPLIIAGSASQLNADRLVINTRKGFSAVSSPASGTRGSISGDKRSAATNGPAGKSLAGSSAQVAVLDGDTSGHDLVPEEAAEMRGEFTMHEIDPEKFVFLRERRGEPGVRALVNSSSICYEPSSDLVWAYDMPLQKTTVYYSDEFLPCESDSLPFAGYVKPSLIAFTSVAASMGILSAVMGGDGSQIAAGALAGGLILGLPAAFFTNWYAEGRNKRACGNFMNRDQVKEWYGQYPCRPEKRQNTNPTEESKNQ